MDDLASDSIIWSSILAGQAAVILKYIAPGGSLTAQNLTFTGGRGPDFDGSTAGLEGGAIESWGNPPLLVIENSTFSGNHTFPGELPYWRQIHGLAANGSQDLANPSGDGVVNLLKYAFNMAPKTGDLTESNNMILAQIPGSNLSIFRRINRTKKRLFQR